MGVPADTDGITHEWLTAALHQAGALDQARVTSIQPAPIGQPGFTGQIRRLQIGYDKPERCAPRSLVAKFSATHPEARAAVHSMGFYEREIGFYRALVADCPVRTPRCYFGEVEMDSGASLLLLEDLSWMHNLDSAGGSVDEAELVIRELAKLHAAWWGDVRLDQIPWLAMRGMLTPDQAWLVFAQNWQSFLGKLSVPVLSWAKLVRTLVDRGERLADVVGQGVFGGQGVAAGVDLDGAVAAQGADEFLDRPTGPGLDAVGDCQRGEDDGEVGVDGFAFVVVDRPGA